MFALKFLAISWNILLIVSVTLAATKDAKQGKRGADVRWSDFWRTSVVSATAVTLIQVSSIAFGTDWDSWYFFISVAGTAMGCSATAFLFEQHLTEGGRDSVKLWLFTATYGILSGLLAVAATTLVPGQ